MTNREERSYRRAQLLDDPRFERFRTLTARRRLVGALIALLLAEAALFTLVPAGPVLLLIAAALVTVACVLCIGLLKASTRGVEELPERNLDEYQLALRGEVYARAYRIGQALLCTELVVVGVWLGFALPSPGKGVVIVALLIPFQLAVVLPTMVAAWHRKV
ncbi:MULTISPECIES: hypothetical protein [unclassified Crossiella]|uniref:hypothetical protein n=1 Tax=unclassified Crossiella TaxID=2620835 RepID=UPI0020003D4D|nr:MULTISPECIES: hypothetical protein [unclassified Crossiella]MCK2242255.1 hypothetical protein [Crossiella sp. S99.2]MCK2254714.1 hypothetical protein [Crossiella sp. S99.1]